MSFFTSERPFHEDIAKYLYYADSELKNYEYDKTIPEKLGIQVISGNVQSGYNIYSYEEPSVLYTKFFYFSSPLEFKVPYYPRYRALNPVQRYEYLTFLENPYKKVDEGYCYLLLYCLERRLSEGKEEVIPIIKKLADCHGGKFGSRCYKTLRLYDLWKKGSLYPQNQRVYANYTLFDSCYDNKSE